MPNDKLEYAKNIAANLLVAPAVSYLCSITMNKFASILGSQKYDVQIQFAKEKMAQDQKNNKEYYDLVRKKRIYEDELGGTLKIVSSGLGFALTNRKTGLMKDHPLKMGLLVSSTLSGLEGMWYVKNRLSGLGEYGKIILLSGFLGGMFYSFRKKN